MLDFSNTQRF